MNFYTKTDLLYNDYDWNITPVDSYKLKGDADRNLFQNLQGNEILYLINCLADKLLLTSKADGREMEKLLHNHFPIGKMSQITACKWLKDAFEQGMEIKKRLI